MLLKGPPDGARREPLAVETITHKSFGVAFSR